MSAQTVTPADTSTIIPQAPSPSEDKSSQDSDCTLTDTMTSPCTEAQDERLVPQVNPFLQTLHHSRHAYRRPRDLHRARNAIQPAIPRYPPGHRFYREVEWMMANKPKNEPFSRCLRRGKELADLMNSSIAEADARLAEKGKGASQSTWRREDLSAHGWEHYPLYDETTEEDINAYTREEFTSCWGLTKPVLTYREHFNDVEFWRSVEDHGFATYHQSHDPTRGAIYATSSHNHFRPGVAGPVAWSDVTFLEWEHQISSVRQDFARHTAWKDSRCFADVAKGVSRPSTDETLRGLTVKALKFVFRINVVNLETRRIIETILVKCRLAKVGQITTAWRRCPDLSGDCRVAIDASTEEGLALLGTPNVYGVAWLLINHKKQMGERRRIDRIWIWTKGPWLNLAVELSSPD